MKWNAKDHADFQIDNFYETFLNNAIKVHIANFVFNIRICIAVKITIRVTHTHTYIKYEKLPAAPPVF